jgi:hypothetical protein
MTTLEAIRIALLYCGRTSCSALTLLGVVIGVAAVIAVVTSSTESTATWRRRFSIWGLMFSLSAK